MAPRLWKIARTLTFVCHYPAVFYVHIRLTYYAYIMMYKPEIFSPQCGDIIYKPRVVPARTVGTLQRLKLKSWLGFLPSPSGRWPWLQMVQFGAVLVINVTGYQFSNLVLQHDFDHIPIIINTKLKHFEVR